jgi:Zn-dependent protease
MPFRCNYCGGYFCGDHRIPEQHNCPEAWQAKAPRDAPPTSTQRFPEKPSYSYSVSYTPQAANKIFWFSKTELKHLLIGTLLVMGVGLTYFLYIGVASPSAPIILAALTVAFTLSFLLHEMAHKFTAQRYNLWAEFRLTMQGALLTLLSVFLPPPFKIIAPGAVNVVGSGTITTIGKISIAGPITNIALSAACALIGLVSHELFWFVAFINAFLALFNLIPFGIMDGLKIYKWNKTYWAVAFATAIALAALTYAPALSSF